MKRKVVCLFLSCLVSGVLLLAACGGNSVSTTNPPTTPSSVAPTTAKPLATVASATKPKYGGTLNLVAPADPTTWDPIRTVVGTQVGITNQQTFEGDWAKGPADGYGSKQTDWAYADSDLFDLKTGYLAESVKWTVDAAKDLGTLVYQVRQGVHWGLNPDSEASRLVNGREMTADDVLFSFQWATTYGQAYVYMNNRELRNADISKTGPWEITVKVPIAALQMAITRFKN